MNVNPVANMFNEVVKNIIKYRRGVDSYENLTVKYYKDTNSIVHIILYVDGAEIFTLLIGEKSLKINAAGKNHFQLALKFIEELRGSVEE